jgi:hypothetical protein
VTGLLSLLNPSTSYLRWVSIGGQHFTGAGRIAQSQHEPRGVANPDWVWRRHAPTALSHNLRNIAAQAGKDDLLRHALADAGKNSARSNGY